MLLVEKNTIGIYNYQGRLTASPRWPNMRLDSLRATQISLSSDTLVVRDSVDPKSNYFFKNKFLLLLPKYFSCSCNRSKQY